MSNLFMTDFSVLLEQKHHILADHYLGISPSSLLLCTRPHFFMEHSEVPMKPLGHSQLPKSSVPGATLRTREQLRSVFYFMVLLCLIWKALVVSRRMSQRHLY